MVYEIRHHPPSAPERVTLHAPSVGIKLDNDEARRVLIDALEAVTDQRAAEKAAPAIAHTGPEGTRVRYR